MASREPKALEDIAEQSFAPRRRPERFVWFHTTYDDHSLSVGPITLLASPAKALSPVAVFVYSVLVVAAAAGWRPTAHGRIVLALCLSTFATAGIPGRSKLGLDEPGRKAGSATTRHGFATAFLGSSPATADAGGSPFRPAIRIGMASLATVRLGHNDRRRCHRFDWRELSLRVRYHRPPLLGRAIRLGIVELMLTERTVSTGRLW